MAVTREAPADARRRTPFETLQERLREQLREIERHEPGTLQGRDPESLHDMRVAVRRLRALLRAGKELVADDTGELDERLKGLGRGLGEVRDVDVLLGHLEVETAELGDEDARQARPLLAGLRKERARRRRRLLAMLRHNRHRALLDDTARAIEQLEPSGSPASLEELADTAFDRLRKVVRALPDDPTDEELHGVRKADKRARYAAELADRARFVKRAKTLQDVLGEHQDAVVAAAWLRELATEAPPGPALAAGRLVEREKGRRAEARAAWLKAWKKLRRTA